MNASWTKYLPEMLRERVEKHQQLKQILGNTGWLFAEKLIRLVTGLTLGVWVARYLGPGNFGLLNYATSFVLLFSAIGHLGLDAIVVRNSVHDPTKRDEILGSALLLKFIGSCAAIVLIIVSIFLLRPDDKTAQILVLITVIGTLFQAFSTIDLWFQSQVQSKYSSCVRTFVLLFIAAFKVYLILTQAPLITFAWAGTADIVACSVGLIIAYRVNGLKITGWRFSRATARSLLKDSWPLMFSDILGLIYMRIDKIMIGEIAGITELGVYSVAAQIADTFLFIPIIVTSSLFPSIVEARHQSDDLFYYRMQRYYNLMAFLAYGVAIPTTLFANWLVPLAFGASYSNAAPMLIGLSWASIFVYFMIARSSFLTAMNWTRLHFIIDAFGCVISVLLYYLLIKKYGAMGAVFASCLSYCLLTHVICFFYKPLRRTGMMMSKALIYPKFW